MRYACTFLIVLLGLTACRDRIICPAFQSTYILDDSTRTAYFSYAWQLDDATRDSFIASLTSEADTLDSAAVDSDLGWGDYYAYAGEYHPGREIVRKNKYGVMKYEPYWLKTYRMKTAPMENVLGPKKEISAPEVIDQGEIIASDFTNDSSSVVLGDSTALALDSTAIASAEETNSPKKKEQRYRFRYDPKDNFNVEQDYYNKYFGVLLLDLTPEPEPIDTLAAQQGESTLPDSLATQGEEGGGIKGKLKGLFGKKKKEENTTEEGVTTTEDPLDEEESDEGGN